MKQLIALALTMGFAVSSYAASYDWSYYEGDTVKLTYNAATGGNGWHKVSYCGGAEVKVTTIRYEGFIFSYEYSALMVYGGTCDGYKSGMWYDGNTGNFENCDGNACTTFSRRYALKTQVRDSQWGLNDYIVIPLESTRSLHKTGGSDYYWNIVLTDSNSDDYQKIEVNLGQYPYVKEH